MNSCPYGHDTEYQVKAGKHESGSQRYKCNRCQKRYTPEPSQRYGDDRRRQAVKLYVDGFGFRQIARHLGVDHVTVMHWVKAHTDQLPAAPLPPEKPLHIIEMDELYSFIGKKKTGSTAQLLSNGVAVALSVGGSRLNAMKPPYNSFWMIAHKQSGTLATSLPPTKRCSTPLVGIPRCRTKAKLFAWRV